MWESTRKFLQNFHQIEVDFSRYGAKYSVEVDAQISGTKFGC